MELSITDSGILVEMKYFAPGRAKKIAEQILNLKHRLYVLSNERARDYAKIRSISEAEQILTSVFSDFLTFFQSVSGMLKKDKDNENIKKLLNDLTNLRKEIDQKTNQLIGRPSEIIYMRYWFEVDTLISQPINALILPPLIASWEESKKEINSNLFECNTNLFYETFHKEVLSLIGQFPMFKIFQAPKTIATPMLSSSDKRDLALGVYEQMKKEEESKEELQKSIPQELIENIPQEMIEKEAEEFSDEEEESEEDIIHEDGGEV